MSEEVANELFEYNQQETEHTASGSNPFPPASNPGDTVPQYTEESTEEVQAEPQGEIYQIKKKMSIFFMKPHTFMFQMMNQKTLSLKLLLHLITKLKVNHRKSTYRIRILRFQYLSMRHLGFTRSTPETTYWEIQNPVCKHVINCQRD